MFAHQVIEAIEKQLQQPHGDLLGGYFRYFSLILKKAQCFYMGSPDEIILTFKTHLSKGVQPFVNTLSQYSKLPYNNISLEFKSINNKTMVVLSKVKEDVFCMCIAHFIRDRWTFTPSLFYVSIGRFFDEQTAYEICQGRRIPICSGSNLIDLYCFDNTNPSMNDVDLQYISNICGIVECSLWLLNCKNITTEIHKPNEALQKARRKRGKQELFTYKTLNLLLPGKKEKHNLTSEPTGEHNRIHYCRGHFKEYTAEAPLFGKITGLWWWQPSVRGKNKDGVVIKDYNIAINSQGKR